MNADEINRQKVMQLATTKAGQPWVCSVYFVVDDGKFYWLSLPDRRHSRELAQNKKAAVTIAIKQSMPVIGLQAEGTVRTVRNLDEIERVLAVYVKKYKQGVNFVERFKKGENRHMLYCLTPREIMLFDESNLLDAPYKRITIDVMQLSSSALQRVGKVR
ncbi:MAG TPA: pyridoxamine 5'-phosphate oxidase family protein [Candidatus Chromulinivoraceae bacterium]|nr:pyridoxamine 5'-phosphate oxidase family protein [Candidatus Chromulinivoraceae bacterium]